MGYAKTIRLHGMVPVLIGVASNVIDRRSALPMSKKYACA
jgi:hypothetical protein